MHGAENGADTDEQIKRETSMATVYWCRDNKPHSMNEANENFSFYAYQFVFFVFCVYTKSQFGPKKSIDANWSKEKNVSRSAHGKNDFAEVFKNWARYEYENMIMLDQNNYKETQAWAKSFDSFNNQLERPI